MHKRQRIVACSCFLDLLALCFLVTTYPSICGRIGLRRFVLLLLFLPLVLGFSRSMGCRCNSLAHKLTSELNRKDFSQWFVIEYKFASILSLCLSVVLGVAAWIASDFDIMFGFAMALASFFSFMCMTSMGLFGSVIFEKLGWDDVPCSDMLNNRVGFGLLGTLAFVGLSLLVLPLRKDDLVCPR